MKNKTKEIQLRPAIAANDITTKRNKAQEMLDDGMRVRVSLKFKGREHDYPENGFEVVDKLLTGLKCKVDKKAELKGSHITTIVSPLPKPKITFRTDIITDVVPGEPGYFGGPRGYYESTGTDLHKLVEDHKQGLKDVQIDIIEALKQLEKEIEDVV